MPTAHSQRMSSLFVYIDESGNFDFSSSGTRHFVMAAVITSEPLESATPLLRLRYRLLSEGRDIPSFHATEDRQEVRDRVFRSFDHVKYASAHVAYCDKRTLPERLRTGPHLHAAMGYLTVAYVVRTLLGSQHDGIVIVFDKVLTRGLQNTLLKRINPLLKATSKPFHVYFHRMITDMNGQTADYLAWSKFVELERGESRPWSSVNSTLRPVESRFLERK